MLFTLDKFLIALILVNLSEANKKKIVKNTIINSLKLNFIENLLANIFKKFIYFLTLNCFGAPLTLFAKYFPAPWAFCSNCLFYYNLCAITFIFIFSFFSF